MKSREVAYLQMLALLSLSKTPRGRKNLAEELRIGEGIVRTLLEGARDLGHVAVMRGGVVATEQGFSFLKEALNLCGVAEIFAVEEAKRLLCGRRCMAYVLQEEVKDPLKTRDSLVRLGACGALILEKRGDRFFLPPLGESLESYDTALASLLKAKVAGDFSVIISCGENYADAFAYIALKCPQKLSL
ncbi:MULTISPECIES: DUF4443 domain-containing protein [Pyrobaculum]|uniref:DUF4443 domain-containing protein n=2 Tax=Pyrobaculum arsenaticum TaxID=121277 RepID=A4WN14_PYRAR|nr:DUF4443 domain-containing protein [Pyrobaculum arsenaticum]ABP51781.1 conserved hypothetical protein [Pyrobaculum arsenaticum DSM 13514]MCY0890023.1 hypothetical protein [Pyrobaculum arsenaticum]NYR16100.1 hypothetical protein [Pyrobaculum arsenaticum]